nr:MAG TPA: hypothetical protein [Caudoviricetes sp.]
MEAYTCSIPANRPRLIFMAESGQTSAPSSPDSFSDVRVEMLPRLVPRRMVEHRILRDQSVLMMMDMRRARFTPRPGLDGILQTEGVLKSILLRRVATVSIPPTKFAPITQPFAFGKKPVET